MSSSTPAESNPTDPARERRTRRGRIAIVALFAMFFVPVVLAYLLNVLAPEWRPFGTTNLGDLVEPARLFPTRDLRAADDDPLPRPLFREKWTLVTLLSDGCGEPCAHALVRMRQSRLAMGKDAARVRRVLVIPDGVAAPDLDRIRAEHPGIRLVSAPGDWSAHADPHGAGQFPGTVWVVDPQGYLVLRYPAALADDALLRDMKRLLRISKIG